jgi:hypothetical protein
MLLLFLLFSLAQAHVPTFENSEAFKIEDKSWGIYKELDKGESFSVLLDVPKGKNISFSVSLAGSQENDYMANETYAKVTLFGHNASQIECDPKFTGWGYRRLDAKLDQTKHIPYAPTGLHFEPFGVGLYRTLASCQAPVPVADDKFNVTVKAEEVIDGKLRISIGAGTAERFTFTEILFLPITISQTWWWDQFFNYFVAAHFVSLFVITTTLYRLRDSVQPRHITIALILHSVMVYGWRFLFVFWDVDLTDADSYTLALFVSLGIHVILPVVVAVTILLAYRYGQPSRYSFYFFHLLLFAYCSLFVVQAFWLAGLSILWLVCRKKNTRGNMYKDLNGVQERELDTI